MGSLIMLLLIIFLMSRFSTRSKYEKSSYKDKSGNDYARVRRDKGLYGEFLTFLKLERLEGDYKLFTNLYLPKEDGTTTEIDLLMLDETGIYVFESKNYSGWIFGDEKYKNWTQTFGSGQKHKFYNPIWQNKGHINALKSVLDRDSEGLYKSYIVFSERCTLKKINVVSPNVKVLQRQWLASVIKQDRLTSEKVLCKEEILELEYELKKYCLVSEQVKLAHLIALNKPSNIIMFPGSR